MIERYVTKPRTIHPVYCVEEGRWYAEDGTSAKSLAGLQIKLPSVQIVDYYPSGFGEVLRPKPKRVVHDFLSEPTPVLKEKDNPLPIEVPTFLPRPRKEDYLNQPMEKPVVAEPVKFRKVVPRVRLAPTKRGYHLAGPRINLVNWKDQANVEKLIKLMIVDKLHVNDAANEMGCTRNAVIGACHRAGISITDRVMVAPYVQGKKPRKADPDVEDRPAQLPDEERGPVPGDRRRA